MVVAKEELLLLLLREQVHPAAAALEERVGRGRGGGLRPAGRVQGEGGRVQRDLVENGNNVNRLLRREQISQI